MMATTHILTGAAVAKVLRRPQWAWPGAFLSYFILDALPHINAEQCFAFPAKGVVAVIDVSLGLGLVAWLMREQADQGVMRGGVAVVLLVGLVSNASHLLRWFSRLMPEPHVGNIVVDIAMQLAVLVAALVILQRGRGDRGEVLGGSMRGLAGSIPRRRQ
jgi:hypothetical protein